MVHDPDRYWAYSSVHTQTAVPRYCMQLVLNLVLQVHL
jgi:hypothetical protein